jgi:hypothetical protein
MIYFSDVDVVLKLARCGFLPWLPALLGEKPDACQVRFLASLRARLKRPNKKLENPRYQQHLADFCSLHSIVGASADLFREEELLHSGMDPGEALLFAEAEATGGIVVTGDKRALAHYAKHSTPAQRHKLKVVCWEQLLLRVKFIKGYEELRRGGCEGISADGLLSLAFSSGLATQEEHATEALQSYLGEVQRHSRDILLQLEI